MALFRVWVLLLIVVLAAHCSESRSTRRHKRDNADYYDTTSSAVENGLQGDASEHEGVQGDDVDDDEDEEMKLPPILRSPPESIRVLPGETVFFPCNIENNSSAVVAWQHGEKKLYQASGTYIGKMDKESKIILHSNLSIEIPSVGAEDVGNYVCKLFGSENSQQVTHSLQLMNVHSPPRIVGMSPQNEGRRVVEGSELRITCHTDGHPKPNLSWSKDDGKTNTRVTREYAAFERDSIVIANVQRHHAGKYICMAENGIGKPAFDSVTIQVVGKPRVHVHKSLVNAAVGVTAIIGCTVHDEPPSVISWTKDNVEVVDSADVIIEQDYPTSTLRIPIVRENDFGTYTCIARNQYGRHNRSAVLVEEPVLEELSVEGETLIWRIQSHMPLNEVQLQYRRTDQDASDWQKVLVKPERTQEHHVHSATYSLRDLPNGKYEAVSRASNNRGWSSPTHSIFFEGLTEEPNPESIQAAGVGGHVGGAAELKSTLTVLTTAATFLLIRLI